MHANQRRLAAPATVVVTTELTYAQANLPSGSVGWSARYATPTLSGSEVTGWAPFLGTGPTFADSGAGNRPLWDSVNKLVYTDTGRATFDTPLSALFDLSQPYTIAFFLQPHGAAANYIAAVNTGDGALDSWMPLQLAGSLTLGGYTDGAATFIDTGVSGVLDTTSLVIMAGDGVGKGRFYRVADQAEASAVMAARSAVGNLMLSLFAYSSGGVSAVFPKFSGIYYLPRKYTTGDYTALKSILATYHAGVLV